MSWGRTSTTQTLTPSYTTLQNTHAHSLVHIPHHHDKLIVITCSCMCGNPNQFKTRELWVMVALTTGTAAISWLVTLASPSVMVWSIHTHNLSLSFCLSQLPSLWGHITLAYAVMHLIAQHLTRASSSKTWSRERGRWGNKFDDAFSSGNLWIRLTPFKTTEQNIFTNDQCNVILSEW